MNTCSICLDDIVNETCTPFTCMHAFHRQCFVKWKHSCPNCRCNQVKRINILDYSKTKVLNLDKYKHFSQSCYDLYHNLIVYQSGVPPFGAIIHCTDCKANKYTPII